MCRRLQALEEAWLGRAVRGPQWIFALAVEGTLIIQDTFPQGLNRLRKKAGFLAEYAQSIAQGLKAALIVLGLCPG
jgi:hypothetical protein